MIVLMHKNKLKKEKKKQISPLTQIPVLSTQAQILLQLREHAVQTTFSSGYLAKTIKSRASLTQISNHPLPPRESETDLPFHPSASQKGNVPC